MSERAAKAFSQMCARIDAAKGVVMSSLDSLEKPVPPISAEADQLLRYARCWRASMLNK